LGLAKLLAAVLEPHLEIFFELHHLSVHDRGLDAEDPTSPPAGGHDFRN